MRNFLETKGYIIIIGLLVLITMYSLLISFPNKTVNNPVNNYIDSETKKLEYEKKAIQHRLDSQDIAVEKLIKKLDSIQNSKAKIQIKYVIKYKEIDSSYSLHIVKEFNNIFARNNVR